VTGLDQLRRLWSHAEWADAALLAALERQPGVPEDALREYAHVVGAEEVWLARLQGRPSRSAVWPGPDLPTVAEAGVPGYVAATWTGVIAPAGVPRPIVDKLNAAINRALKSEAFLDKFSKFGDEPGGGTPEEFAATIKADSAKWADVVKRSGAKLD